MKIENMQDLFVGQIEDLYDAEKRLVRALPKMAEGGGFDDRRGRRVFRSRASSHDCRSNRRAMERVARC
jgi:ferritin-like metal-binding protein YciE